MGRADEINLRTWCRDEVVGEGCDVIEFVEGDRGDSVGDIDTILGSALEGAIERLGRTHYLLSEVSDFSDVTCETRPQDEIRVCQVQPG
jgi:hypothetical protein